MKCFCIYRKINSSLALILMIVPTKKESSIELFPILHTRSIFFNNEPGNSAIISKGIKEKQKKHDR